MGALTQARTARAVPKVIVKSRHRQEHVTKDGRVIQGCKYKADADYLACDCPKQLQYSFNGKLERLAADTTDWRIADAKARDLEGEFAAKASGGSNGQNLDAPVPISSALTIALASPNATKAKLLTEVAQSFLVLKKDSHNRQTKERLSQKHLTKLSWTLERFLQFASDRGLVNLTDVEPEHIIDWRTSLRRKDGRAYAQGYKAKLVVYLKEFFSYCGEMKWITSSPVSRYANVSSPDPQKPKALSDEQVEQLFATIPKLKQNDMTSKLPSLLLLMRWTGLALRDAVLLKQSAITKNGGGFWKAETSRAKTNKPVYCTITAEVAQKILAGANQAGKYLFVESAPKSEREEQLILEH